MCWCDATKTKYIHELSSNNFADKVLFTCRQKNFLANSELLYNVSCGSGGGGVKQKN